jgi:CheY-like chemotaxis protein
MKTLRILIVEDEELVLSTLLRQLRRSPFDADTATNGQEGLARIEGSDEPYDVLLTDFNMPVMTGLHMIHEINQLPSDKRPKLIIAMTGRTENLDILAREAPGVQTISKPFIWSKVEKIIEEFFRDQP